jgi:hypothetical protein
MPPVPLSSCPQAGEGVALSHATDPARVVIRDRKGLRVMGRAECLDRLRLRSFGRVGVSIGALPTVLPVNYRVVDESIVFRTGAGTKLQAASSGTVVAFEIDDHDPITHSGWSVVAVGPAQVVEDPAILERYERIGIPQWAAGADDRFVAIEAELVFGRELGAS